MESRLFRRDRYLIGMYSCYGNFADHGLNNLKDGI
jgi:hypothetical protein